MLHAPLQEIPHVKGVKRNNKEASSLYAELLSHVDDVQMTYIILSKISPEVLLLCHPHVIHTSSACHPQQDFTPKIISS